MNRSNADITVQHYIDEQLGLRSSATILLHPSAQESVATTTIVQHTKRRIILLSSCIVLALFLVLIYLTTTQPIEQPRQALTIQVGNPVTVAIKPRAIPSIDITPSQPSKTQKKKQSVNHVLNNASVSTSPNNESTTVAVTTLIAKTNLAELSEQLVQGNATAAEALERLRNESPHDADIFLLWLKHHIAVNFNESIAQASSWLVVNNGNAAIAQFTAESLLRNGKPNEAIAILNAQSQRAPLSFDARLIEALAWQKRGDHAVAIQQLRHLLLQDPTHGQSHAALAISLKALGAEQESIQHWRAALNDSKLPDTLRALALQLTSAAP